MSNESFIAPPVNVQDPFELRMFFIRLIEKLDILFGYRGESGYLTVASVQGLEQEVMAAIAQAVASVLANIDARNYTSNPQQLSIADETLLELVASATYEQSEVQALADKLDATIGQLNAVLAALRTANILEV